MLHNKDFQLVFSFLFTFFLTFFLHYSKMIEKKWCYSLDEKISRKQLSDKYSEEYCKQFSSSQISHFYRYIENYHIWTLMKENAKGNTFFSKIPQSPHILYYIGNIDLINTPSLWIVWPRNPSVYAIDVVHELCRELKLYNLITISWWAEGIDSICHKESIENNIPTICILWWWIDYYIHNNNIINRIIWQWWLILSEFKIFSKPEKYTFPMRNRIIAWLSDYLFIPEAWEKSGSLLTAKYMHWLHKPIYGVIWNILKQNNKWLHNYIQENKITPIFSIKDLCKNLFKEKGVCSDVDINNYNDIWTYWKKILGYRNQGSISFETIYYELWIKSDELLSEISLLELEWCIKFKDNFIYFI